jgi:type IV fimbrial biogenesis protein FimT
MDRHRGFTLAELVFTLAIVAGLLGWGLPAFRDLHRNAERTREVNQLVHAVHYARSEAIKRNGVVSLCPSMDGTQCAPAGSPWHLGWIAFVNSDRDSPAERDPGEEILQVFAPWRSGLVLANRDTLSFRPFGQMGVTASFTFCDDRGATAARAVIISQTGRPRVSQLDASGEPLTCA